MEQELKGQHFKNQHMILVDCILREKVCSLFWNNADLSSEVFSILDTISLELQLFCCALPRVPMCQ